MKLRLMLMASVCLPIAVGAFVWLHSGYLGDANLRVSGDGPASWSHGVWVRAAWRVMPRPTPHTAGATWSDPREGTSIAPPLP